MAIVGTSGNDHLNGTAAGDLFQLFQGGNDTANGRGGDDTFELRAAFTAADKLVGGGGSDTLELKGNYSAGVIFGATTISGIETIRLLRGFDYSLTMNDANVAAGDTLAIRAGALGAANHLVFSGNSEIDGAFDVIAGAGNDTITGGVGDDTFDLSLGGDDVAFGAEGNDLILMGSAWSADDLMSGGGGADTMVLDGDYSAGLTVTNSMCSGIEKVTFAANHAYSLLWHAAIGSGITVDSSAFATGEPLLFDGSSILSGSFHFITGASSDHELRGGAGDDIFDFPLAQDFVAYGGGGADTFNVDDNYSTLDRIVGDAGSDTVTFDGDYVSQLFLTQGNIFELGDIGLYGIEKLVFRAGHTYDVIIQSDLTSGGGTLRVNAANLHAGDALTLDLTVSLAAGHIVAGGRGNDTILCSLGTDTIRGGKGHDAITAGDGVNTFAYATGDSNGTARDVLTNADWDDDKIDVPVTVTAVAIAVTEGAGLNEASFDSDLKDGADAVLADYEAIYLSVQQGDLAGRTFIIVDANDSGTYDAGVDLAIEVITDANAASFDADNFI